MSIASEITRLQNAKSALKSAIENKGVTVPSSTKLDGYASLVNSIPGIVPEGTINITENGDNIDVKQYAKANVNVQEPLSVKAIGINSIKYASGATAKIHPTSLGTNYGDFDYIVEVEFNQPIDETTVSAEDFKYNTIQVESISFVTSTSVNFKISNLSTNVHTNNTLKYKDNVILLCVVEMPSIIAWHWNDSAAKSLYSKQDETISSSNPMIHDTEPMGTFLYDKGNWDGSHALLNDSTLKWRLQKDGTSYYGGVSMNGKSDNTLYLETSGAFAVTPEKDDLIILEFNGQSLRQWLYL